MSMQATASSISIFFFSLFGCFFPLLLLFLRRRHHDPAASMKTLYLFLGMFLLSSCAAHSAPEPRNITLQQQWTLNPGDDVAGSTVAGSLGDISLQIDGRRIRAPFDGELELSEADGCAFYSTPEIPAYLFRLCGLDNVNYGDIKAEHSIGKGDFLSFATLRRQPDGTRIIVEQARGV